MIRKIVDTSVKYKSISRYVLKASQTVTPGLQMLVSQPCLPQTSPRRTRTSGALVKI